MLDQDIFYITFILYLKKNHMQIIFKIIKIISQNKSSDPVGFTNKFFQNIQEVGPEQWWEAARQPIWSTNK